MGKGFIITKDGQEIALNISQIEHIFNETVQFAGGLNIGPYDTQTINEIKVAVEAYSPGVSPEVIEDLERQISELNEQITVLDAQIGSLNEQISSLETENTELITQRDTLIAEKEQLEAQVAALTAEVELAYQRGYEDGYNAAGGDWHSSNPLCFTAEQANSTIKTANGRLSSPEISYNGTDWEEYTEGTIITLTNIGDKVYFRSKLIAYSQSSAFTMTGKIAASGNPESLHEGTKGEVYSYCYYYMFYGCTGLTAAPELPATTLTQACYTNMFYGCTGLTAAPELPATTLTTSCYQNMFYGCTGLTAAPELPATELAYSCYQHMFYNCTSLTTAPELPATNLARLCYQHMFQGCTSLTTTPELPATTLAEDCYEYMFDGCTSLTTAPNILPATKLAQYCYRNMFSGCKSLTTAPELPATTLTTSCYYYMFSGCSNLNYIKVGATSWSTSYSQYWVSGVSATGTFVKNDYVNITSGTSGIPNGWTVETIETITENPLCFTAEESNSTLTYGYGSTTYSVQTSNDGNNWSNYSIGALITLENVGDKVYFRGTGKTTDTNPAFKMTGKIAASGSIMSLIDPTGKSKEITSNMFQYMFSKCTSLTTAPELPATALAYRCYRDMFYGCTSLTTAPELPATTLAQDCYVEMFSGCSNLNYIKVGATSWTASYANNWVNGVSATGTFVKPEATTIPTGTNGIPKGWEVKGPEPEDYKGLCFTAVNANSTIAQNIGKEGCTYSTSTDGIDWEPYTLGAVITLTNAGDKVYWKGNGINNTTINPVFVMTGVINASGSIMSLIDGVGESTDMTGNAFNRMFLNCKSLYKAPELPATTLSPSCYQYMFANCTGLSTAPELPAKEVSHYEYEYMFQSCYNIQYIKVGATSWNTSDTDSWLYGSAGTGTFVKPKDTVIPTGTSGIPSGWTVRDSDLTGDNVLNEDSKYLIRKYPFSNNRFIYDFGPISSGAELEVLYDGTVIGVERIVGNTYTVHNAEWTGGLIDDNANFNYSFGNSVVMQYQRVGREEMWVEI